MILFALLLGLFAELIFLLGIVHLYYLLYIALLTSIYWVTAFYFLYSRKKQAALLLNNSYKKFSKFELFLCLSLSILALVNLLGALSPDLAFDALWYHLTLPKLYLMHHGIWHIPGGLLYYSDMPKLGELLYVVTLSLGNEIIGNLVQFFAGIFVSVAIFKIANKYLNRTYSLLAVIIFYSNLAVAWESTTAYVDLIRGIFEVTALWSFIIFSEKGKTKYLLITFSLIGFAIMSKLIALGTLIIFLALYLYLDSKNKHKILMSVFLLFISLLPSLPWFIFSYIHTSNPVYPFFTSIYPTSFDMNLLNPVKLIVDLTRELTMADDPISPIYIIAFPLIVLYWKRFSNKHKLIIYYSAIALLAWYITPRTGGGRFLIPYLPAFSIVIAILINNLRKNIYWEKLTKNGLIIIILLLLFTTILYRGLASIKYLPVVIGKESKSEFLTKNLNFNFGDFYDTDGYFSSHIKSTDVVLLIGFHNLYYANFFFIDSSWLKATDKFDYIATQHTKLPSTYKSWKLVYANNLTGIDLYKK